MKKIHLASVNFFGEVRQDLYIEFGDVELRGVEINGKTAKSQLRYYIEEGEERVGAWTCCFSDESKAQCAGNVLEEFFHHCKEARDEYFKHSTGSYVITIDDTPLGRKAAKAYYTAKEKEAKKHLEWARQEFETAKTRKKECGLRYESKRQAAATFNSFSRYH